MTVYGKTRREVQNKLDEIRLQQAQGVPLSGRRDTIATLLDRWYSTLKPRPQGRYSPTTLKGYADAIRLHLKPRLGHVRIADLNADHVQALQDGMLAAGLAGQTVLNVRNILRGAVRHAMRQRLMTYNPVELVEAPPGSSGAGQAIEPEGARLFLAAIAGHRLEAAFLMELALGCRRSEILGLEWDALDLRPGHERLRVRQGLHRVKGQGLLILTPKSQRGDRTLALPRRLATLLRQRQDDQVTEQLLAGEHWQNTRPDGRQRLVFTTTRGTPCEPSHFTNAIKAALRAAGVGHLRGHDLRHSASSILQALGLPPLAAMEVLGHASPDVTMGIYGHLLSASRRQAAELMDDYLDQLEGVPGAARPASS
jgi:integrase